MSDEVAKDLYAAKGFGQKFEYGTNPAVVVIDFSCGFTDPACTLGSDLTKEVLATKRLLDAARAKGLLVVYTTIGFDTSGKDGALWLK